MVNKAVLDSMGTIVVNVMSDEETKRGTLRQRLALRYIEGEEVYAAMFSVECDTTSPFVDHQCVRKGSLLQVVEWLEEGDLRGRVAQHLGLHGQILNSLTNFIFLKASPSVRAIAKKDGEKAA
jgi:hypothetical protein